MGDRIDYLLNYLRELSSLARFYEHDKTVQEAVLKTMKAIEKELEI